MSEIKWQEILRDCVKENTIKSIHLRKIPKLLTCEHWDKATFLGRVSHTFAHSKLDGGLIKYEGRIYYINIKQISALISYIKWPTHKYLKVID